MQKILAWQFEHITPISRNEQFQYPSEYCVPEVNDLAKRGAYVSAYASAYVFAYTFT